MKEYLKILKMRIFIKLFFVINVEESIHQNFALMMEKMKIKKITIF